MRKPEKPPGLHEIDGIEDDFLEKLSSPEVTEFVRKANNRYMHWDKVRHMPRPDGLSAEHAWGGNSVQPHVSKKTASTLDVSHGPKNGVLDSSKAPTMADDDALDMEAARKIFANVEIGVDGMELEF